MSLKDLLAQSVNIATKLEYLVFFGDDEPEKVSYIHLGVYLTTHEKEIESIKIKLKEA